MNCKNCDRELPEFGEFCPYCGEPRQENQTTAPEMTGPEIVVPQKKNKVWLVLLIALVSLAVLAGLVIGVLTLTGVIFQHNTDAPEQNLPQDDPVAGDAEQKQEELSETDKLLLENSRNVVASLGGKTLTVGELQMQYQSVIYGFYSQNYYYMSYLGLDLTQPLDTQYVPSSGDEEPMTWQDYFIDAAISNWEYYVRLELLAEAEEGFQMDPELKAGLDDMENTALSMATAYGYEDVDSWLSAEIGTGVTLDDYYRYNLAYYTGAEYLNYFYTVNIPTEDQIESYYQENEAVFLENGVTKDLGLNAAVRHILIQPTGGTTNENNETTYSEEEWAAAKAEAERIYELWKQGEATEESFAEFANTYSTDGGSNTTGGLYEDVNVDASYVLEFENWAIDEARQPGDTGIVETEFGYHIMYFVSGELYWQQLVSEQLVAEWMQELMLENTEAYPLELTRENILLGTIEF